MTPHTTPLTPLGDPTRRRTALVAFCLCIAGLLALTGCGVGAKRVDAGVASSDAPAVDAETDCPEWANEVMSAAAADSDVDIDGLGDHYRDRSVVLDGIADRLPAADAEIVQAYADAVAEFGDDPLSPGLSRRMGEAAADASVMAARSC